MPRRKSGKKINGILLLDKPFGLSSNKALQRARYLLDANKAGHTGSLDPYATGLLPLCFGEATKVSQFMLGLDKSYEVEIHFGIATTSGDAEGEVTEKKSTASLTLVQIEQALSRFHGRIKQVPPMFSALKKDGQPLYKLARKGIEIERPARDVKTYNLKILNWQPPKLTLHVACSSGFYIRSLAIDLGKAVNNVAHVSVLRRTQVGPFSINDSVTLNEFEALSEQFRVQSLLSPDKALNYPTIELNSAQKTAFMLGQSIDYSDCYTNLESIYCVYSGGVFLGIGETVEKARLKAKRIFNLTSEYDT